MSVIKRQIPNVNFPSLRRRAFQYFPLVTDYLRRFKLPEDFKYLPIVESGFTLELSSVGARGFWQFMVEDGQEYGLIISSAIDERDDLEKSTIAACRELVDYYNIIYKKTNVASWVMTAAAYNFGIGNILKAMQNQGTDYFSMKLNPETANYVYKLVAIKELFEYPELYMKDFGYNVFTATAPEPVAENPMVESPVVENIDTSVFNSASLKLGEVIEKESKEIFIGAQIEGKYKNFRDGDIVSIKLGEDLLMKGGFFRKGVIIKGAGWVIDDRIYVDLGYGHDLILYDVNSERGISFSSLKKDTPVLLKNSIYDDQSQWK